MLSVVCAASQSYGNDSYNTNSPRASVVTVTRNHSHMCAHAAFTSPQLLFEGGVYFVQELRIVWLLFKDGVYLKKYGTCECTNYLSSPLTNGIGGGLLALLVHAVVSGDCSMCCLTLHCSSIRTY